MWLDFPDVEEAAKAVGAPPTRANADRNPGYTIPFITVTSQDKPTVALSDSAKIAAYIEETFPSPDHTLLPAESRVFQSIFTKYLFEKVTCPIVMTLFMPYIRHMRPHTQEWFIESRTRTFGMSLTEMLPQDEAGIETAWRNFDAGFDDLAIHLDNSGGGNYRLTADFAGPFYES